MILTGRGPKKLIKAAHEQSWQQVFSKQITFATLLFITLIVRQCCQASAAARKLLTILSASAQKVSVLPGHRGRARCCHEESHRTEGMRTTAETVSRDA